MEIVDPRDGRARAGCATDGRGGGVGRVTQARARASAGGRERVAAG